MVPDGWCSKQVSDICRLKNGHGFKPEEWDTEGLPIIRIQNLNGEGGFNYFSGEVDDDWVVNPGQMLFAWAGTKGVSFGPTIWSGPKGVLNQHIFKVFAAPSVDHQWLYYCLRHVTDRIERRAHGFKATLVHVKKSEIDNQLVQVPPIAEQRKIAEILSTWGRAIKTIELIVRNSERQKKALMSRLLSGKERLRGFSDEWKIYQLKDICSRVTKKNSELNNNVLTISAQHGLVPQETFFNKRVASETLEGYFLLSRGQFAYNKSYSNGYPMGAIKRLRCIDSGVVTTLYICFEISDCNVCSPGFLEHYFDHGMLNRGLAKVANEGGRAHGLLNVKPSDFFGLEVKMPVLEEQIAIEKVLTSADREVNILKQQLELLRAERTELMRKLLTGKRRVKVGEEQAA